MIPILLWLLIVMLVFSMERQDKRIDGLQKQIKLLGEAAELAGKNIDWESNEPTPGQGEL